VKQWIDLGRVSLRYELTGEGPSTLVLVHEMGGTLDSWDGVLPKLAQGRRVLRYDTRGAGQSEKIGHSITFDTMVDDLAALLYALGITGKVALAGTAVGAGIALQFAVRHPERTAAVIATSPATGLVADRRAAGIARADDTERLGMRAVVEASFASSYPPITRHDHAVYETFRARWLANVPSSYAAIYRMLVNGEIELGFHTIACPVLVVGGTHDLLRPPASAQAVAQMIPGAEFLEVESGHFMAVQTPVAVGMVFSEFLAARGL
jgi:3-oxoadipate enol-lactonase